MCRGSPVPSRNRSLVTRQRVHVGCATPAEFAKDGPSLSLHRSYTVHFFDLESGQVKKVLEDDGVQWGDLAESAPLVTNRAKSAST